MSDTQQQQTKEAAPQNGAAASNAETPVHKHTLTQEDLDTNPHLAKEGLKVGDEIEVEDADPGEVPAELKPGRGKKGDGKKATGKNPAPAETKKSTPPPVSSVSIGKTVGELKFIRFKHPDGRSLQWKLASHALVSCDGDRFTPEDLHADKTPDRLLAFEKAHPAYFEEIFE